MCTGPFPRSPPRFVFSHHPGSQAEKRKKAFSFSHSTAPRSRNIRLHWFEAMRSYRLRRCLRVVMRATEISIVPLSLTPASPSPHPSIPRLLLYTSFRLVHKGERRKNAENKRINKREIDASLKDYFEREAKWTERARASESFRTYAYTHTEARILKLNDTFVHVKAKQG